MYSTVSEYRLIKGRERRQRQPSNDSFKVYAHGKWFRQGPLKAVTDCLRVSWPSKEVCLKLNESESTPRERG